LDRDRCSGRAPVRQPSESHDPRLSATPAPPGAHIDKIHTPLVLAHGTLETPEFQRQTRDFAAALLAAGKAVQLIVGRGCNHYEMGETLGNPYAIVGRAALEMMKLMTA
jgi:arylformamidase